MLYTRRRRALADDHKVGTNLIMINLEYSTNVGEKESVNSDSVIIEKDNPKIVETKYVANSTVIVVLIIVVLLVIICSVAIVLYVRRTARSTRRNDALPEGQRSTAAETDSFDQKLPPQAADQVKNITISSKMVGTAV